MSKTKIDLHEQEAEARESVDAIKAEARSNTTNPIVILLGILVLAMVLTYVIDSGAFERQGNLVVPGSFEVIEKDRSLANLFAIPGEDDGKGAAEARPVSFIGTLMAIPEGLSRGSGLIFMVLIIGGMFGILTRSGAIDAGLERLLSVFKGNMYVLVPGLMVVFSAGSSFLGLASEYLLVIPIMAALSERLGMSRIIGLAVVTVSVKVGYLTSVTNPIPLTIAQPLVGLQIFSGAGFRFACYLVFLTVGIAFMMVMVRRAGFSRTEVVEFSAERLSLRHTLSLLALVMGVGILVYASNRWHWHHDALSAYYIGLSLVLAALSGLGASEAANAFVFGMKKVLMASVLIGVATAVSVVLADGRVLDTVVNSLTNMVGGGGPVLAAQGMFVSQLLLDFLIPSTSGQAAVSMPILGPIGQLSGVPPQTTVLAFLFGNGLTNMLTPTSGTLLAYLATAQVGWGRWAKFIFPLWLIFSFIAMVLLTVAVEIGF
ncbi:YfcC family protein [Kordiimonas sp.]|uniref:YfcC family protein n=1 Tax=Kordiimonas sp. TaxID=1970157 RepID=UPI003A903140